MFKKCRKFDDVLFINASEYYDRGKCQNVLLPEHIDKIFDTYQYRKEDNKKYSRRVSLKEIKKQGLSIINFYESLDYLNYLKTSRE